jgi:hypothetical protein
MVDPFQDGILSASWLSATRRDIVCIMVDPLQAGILSALWGIRYETGNCLQSGGYAWGRNIFCQNVDLLQDEIFSAQ